MEHRFRPLEVESARLERLAIWLLEKKTMITSVLMKVTSKIDVLRCPSACGEMYVLDKLTYACTDSSFSLLFAV